MARVIGTLALSGDTQAPTQPQNLQATAVNRQRVDLTWTASTDNVAVAGYQVFRDGSPLDTSATTTYSDTTASASTTYTYDVVAFDAAGNSSVPSASAQATTPANASPTWQTIADQDLIVGDAYSIDLNDFCDDADADTIVYSVISGTLPTGITLVGAVISGTPTTAGQALTVGVRAFDGFVNVDTTIDYATFTTDVTAPPVPTGLVASGGSSQVDLSWDVSTDVAGTANEFVSGTQDYRLYRSTDQTNFSLRATVTGTTYEDTGLAASTRYDYKITARDVELNESSQSTAVNATTQAAGSTLVEDWNFRISDTGVVWYHDFQSAAEVDNFRWSGGKQNDPLDNSTDRSGTVVWNPNDGITGGCLQINRADNTQDPSNWWRMFSPLTGASNGRGVDDPGANGTIALKTFTPTNGGSQTSNWDGGFYGHASYHTGNNDFDGTEYYIQAVVKMDPNRIAGGNPDGGKFFYFTTTEDSNTSQEVVTISAFARNDFNGTLRNYFRMYRSETGTNLINEPPGVSVAGHQPGSEFADDYGICNYLTSSDEIINNCWYWPLGEWCTFLWHVRPGLDSNSDTLIEVLAARPGESTYTRIWKQTAVDLPFIPGQPFGHNAVIGSAYMNAQAMSVAFYHRIGQIIHSKNFIPCPKLPPATTLATEVAALSAGQSSLPSSIPTLDAHEFAFNWQSRWHYDPAREKLLALGRRQNDSTGAHHIAVFDESANTWGHAYISGFPNTTRGHTWEMPTYDRKNGRWFSIENGGQHDRVMHCEIDTQNPLLGGSAWNLTAYRGTDETGQSWASPNNVLNTGNGPDFVSGSTGMAYHPNLFGQNKPGIVIPSQLGVIAYRFDTDNYVVLVNRTTWNTASGNESNDRVGILYCEGLDAVFFYSNFGTARYKIASGPVVTTIAAPPVPFHHDVQEANCAAMVDDPLSRPWFYAFEKFGARLWKYNPTTDAYSVVTTSHPFLGRGSDPGDFIVCALYGLGAIAGLERSSSSTWQERLYKPA